MKEIICNFRSSTTGGSAQENKPLTEVTSENRNVFVDVINSLKVGGGTCLGLGLMKGMDVRGEPLINMTKNSQFNLFFVRLWTENMMKPKAV